MAALGVSSPLLIGTIALQLGVGLAVGLGFLTRLGAVCLGLFCLATAALFHTNFASQNELLHFEKDLAIAGRMFILAIAGAGAISLASTDCLAKRRQRDGDMIVPPQRAVAFCQWATSSSRPLVGQYRACPIRSRHVKKRPIRMCWC